MKKAILFLLFSTLVSSVYCQKKDTVKKPEFKINQGKLYKVPALTPREISLLTMLPEDWKALSYSNNYTGLQIENIKNEAQATRDKLKKVLADQLQKELNAFNDSVKKSNKIKIKRKSH